MTNENPTMQGAICPVPLPHSEKIVLGHGSGGTLSHKLINDTFLSSYGNPTLQAANDAGVVNISGFSKNGIFTSHRLAISTDSHVVYPLFFPGGDIGRLAVCGTVNDVSMMGAQPKYLTVGFILEEGLPIETLKRVIESMKYSADEAGVQIIAGDTKVVQKGKADGLFINTSGIGAIPEGININGSNAKSGDVVLISGSIGDHGMAVLSARGELGFESDIMSDIAPLNHLVKTIIETGASIHTLRDPTRGGLATSLNEIAQQSQVCIEIEENSIPINVAVQSACEMLGFDPLYVANEGKLIAITAPQDAQKVLKGLKGQKYGEQAEIIGRVIKNPPGRVLLNTPLGTKRVVNMLSGEMLPRIC